MHRKFAFHKSILGSVIATVSALVLAGCLGGGGSSSSTPASNNPPATTNPPATATGIIRGVVADNSTGLPIAGATVTAGTGTTTTLTDGTYEITGLAAAPRIVVNISASNYANGSRVTAVPAGGVGRVDAVLLPAYTASVDPTMAANVSVPNSNASVALPANSLRTSANAAPSGTVSVSLTPMDPSGNTQIMPGDFTTSTGGQLESFGAMDVTVRDATGAALNLASGASSTITIPVAAGSTPSPTMGLWYYNSTTGQWVQEGTLTLYGTAPNQYYSGTVTHFSTWNADQTYNTTCVSGTVVDAAGTPVANARIDAEGQGYIGSSTAYSATNGSFSINIKANASAIITARTATAVSNSIVVTGGAAGTTCTPMASNPSLGSSTTGSASIKLTWGANPSDLDSHLSGPDAGGTRFHVYFGNRGYQTAAPYAMLDVDDTSGFGPEVVTISRFTPGVYHYSVHHYSGTSSILASPARVELTLNGVTRVFTPPSCATTAVWSVMDLNVDSAGNVTVAPINSCVTAVPLATAGGRATEAGGAKPPMADGNW